MQAHESRFEQHRLKASDPERPMIGPIVRLDALLQIGPLLKIASMEASNIHVVTQKST